MVLIEVVGILISIIAIIGAFIYRKITYWQSNIPSPGLLWFRDASGNKPEDLKDFCEKNKVGIVQGWIVATTENNWLMYLLRAKSHAMAAHPDIAQLILKDEETFVKESDSFGEMGELVKESLGSLNGPEYKAMRDIMGPSFHYNYIKQFVPVFQEKTQELFNWWKENGAINVDVHADLHSLVYEIVAQKEKAGSKAERDFLDRLLAEKEKLSDDQVRDNVFMMFLAGHETTAGALSWALYFLAEHPEYQKTAREEVESVLKGAIPDSENVKMLPFLDMFIKESMRRKSGTFSSRIANKDSYVGNYFIPKGTRVGLSIQTIHHLKEFWPEPEKFDPYRFTPERSAGRHPYAFIPFSLGRRMCIGNNFSLLEQRIFLAMILQQFAIEKSKEKYHTYKVWKGEFPMGMKLNFVPKK